MRSTKKIVVIYIILPLMVMSFALPAFNFIVSSNTQQSHVNIKKLASVGLMLPITTGGYSFVHEGPVGAFDTYNEVFGDSSTTYNRPIAAYNAQGSAATASRLGSYLRYRDRLQITSHGSMTSDGPSVDLYGSTDLTPLTYIYWGYVSGKCMLLHLTACNSMGGGKGTDTRLVNIIKDYTAVKMVIGFNGEAELFAAGFLSMNFWWQHIAGRRGLSDNYGGYDGATAHSRAKWMLESFIHDLELTTGLILLAAILGIAGGWTLGILSEAQVLTHLLRHVLPELIGESFLHLWISAMEDTMDAYCFINDREYVSSLTPIGTGGGGGGGIVITTD